MYLPSLGKKIVFQMLLTSLHAENCSRVSVYVSIACAAVKISMILKCHFFILGAAYKVCYFN